MIKQFLLKNSDLSQPIAWMKSPAKVHNNLVVQNTCSGDGNHGMEQVNERA